MCSVLIFDYIKWMLNQLIWKVLNNWSIKCKINNSIQCLSVFGNWLTSLTYCWLANCCYCLPFTLAKARCRKFHLAICCHRDLGSILAVWHWRKIYFKTEFDFQILEGNKSKREIWYSTAPWCARLFSDNAKITKDLWTM